jgi:short-subunit dehydrogenase
MAEASRTVRPLALVTGASAGIGAAFARAYAARGYDLALVARRVDRLDALARELSAARGIEAFAVPADLAAWEACEAVLAAVAQRGRHVDALVNNAGFSIPQSFAGVAWDRQRDFLMTLVVNACGLAHGVIPGWSARPRGDRQCGLAGGLRAGGGGPFAPWGKGLMVSWSQALARS